MKSANKIIRMQYLIKWLLCLYLLQSAFSSNGQNINNPNKQGPLGTQVNTYSGNLFLSRTDMKIPARGFDLDISFKYNSYNFDTENSYGKGWSFEYNIRYSTDTLNGKVITWGNGREDTYALLAGGTYKAPLGFFNTLSQYQPNKFLLTELDGRKYYFDNSTHKRLTKMEEPNGNFINLNYTDSLLTSLTNAAGQTITFTYNATGRLATVVDAITAPTRIFSYAYDNLGNLKEVTDPLGGKNKYTYLVNGPMKTVADRNDNVVNIIYFSDLSVSELIGCNKRMSFSYDTTSLTTVVTDHLSTGNQVTSYKYIKIENLAWITSMSGNCCGFNMTYEFDEKGNKIKETDANGNSYNYTYDATGNMLTMTDPENQTSTYTYTTAFNNLTSYTDPKGNVYTLAYNANGNLTQLIAPGNLIYTAAYAANGDITSSTDPKGNIYTYNYDTYGNPTNVTGPNGYNATLSFNARGNLLAYTDARGNTHTAEFDILDRLKKITDPNNNFVRSNYDAEGNPVAIITKNNETSLLSYDASNRLVKKKDPIGNTAEFYYDGMDNIIGYKNALNNIKTFNYDTRNRLTNQKDALGNVKAYNYDPNGNIISATHANGQQLSYTYDKVNRLKAVSDNTGSVIQLSHDKNNNIITITNGTGAITTRTYDSLNRIKTLVDALGKITATNYDKNNNITTVTDRNGFVKTHTYDSLNRVKTYTDNNGFVITVLYDAEGNISQLKDQNNNSTNYTYDNLNRLKRTTFPNATFNENIYDVNNNIISKRLTDGTFINIQYDSINRPVSRTLPSGVVYSYNYDALGRITSATNNNGTVTLTYDKLNRILSETFEGRVTSYQYDIAGRTQTTVYPDSSIITKEFDTRNRLTKLLKNAVPIVIYQYNNANQNTVKTFANGVVTNMQYDFANRLSNIVTANGTIQNTTFTYDNERNKTAVIRLNNPAASEQFVYDNGYRVTNYKRGPTGTPITQNSYTYDAVGNRNSANLNGIATSYISNNLNQLINSNNGSQNINFTYDARGNLTFDGVYYKTYDTDGWLIKDSSSATNVLVYKYDAFNRRVQKILNGNVLKYSYSGLTPIEERDGNNTLLNKTIFTGFLQPLLNEKNGVPYYYHQNELNSVEAISGSNGNLKERYQYDLFGKPTKYDSAGNVILGSLTGNRFGFTGQEYDSASNSYRFFYRNYSASTGTFNQRDLIGYTDGMGMYQYVGNNPANGIDILGLEDCYTQKDTRNDLEKFVDGYDKVTNLIDGAEDLGVKTPLRITKTVDFLNPYVDLARGANDFNKGSVAQGSEAKIAAVGDAIKNWTKSAAGFTGIIGGLTANPAVVGGAAATSATIDLVDAKSKELFDKISEENEEMREQLYEDQLRRDYGEEYFKKWKDIQTRKQQQFTRWKLLNCPPQEGPRKNRPKQPGIIAPVTYIQANDPNLIIGPAGEPNKAWVSVKDRLPYTILYENDSTASAPAKYVKITTPIEPKQDPATFELGSFGFNNETFTVPNNTAAYYQRLDSRDSSGLFVDITAGYDQINNVAFWEFQSIDPVTLLPPSDPFKGFLFLQDSTQANYGNGFVNFTIKPRQTTITLDTISAKASIIFDQNDTVPTNIHKNTIDAFAPTSHMSALPATSTNPMALSWTGADDVNGCGIRYYTLYVSTDGTNFSILKKEITRTDTTITGSEGLTYYYFVLATDSVGNMEMLRLGEIKSTVVGGVLPVSILYFNGKTINKDNMLTWATSAEQNSKSFELERSLDGSIFNRISTIAAAGNSNTQKNYQYKDVAIDKLNSAFMYYRLKQIDQNNSFKYSNIVRLNYKQNNSLPSIVYPNPTQGIISISVGDAALVGSVAILTDANGRILQKVKIMANTQSLDLSSYTNGIYFIKLKNNEILKLVKQ